MTPHVSEVGVVVDIVTVFTLDHPEDAPILSVAFTLTE